MVLDLYWLKYLLHRTFRDDVDDESSIPNLGVDEVKMRSTIKSSSIFRGV